MKVSYDFDPKWVIKNNRGWLEEDWYFIVDGVKYWIPALIYDIDGASIPWLFRKIPFIGRPFDLNNLLGAGAHDPLFLTHVLGFDKANEVARQLWVQSGKSKFAAGTMKAAVSSPFGKLAYYNTQADIEELNLVRRQIKRRQDWQKFETLWFSPPA